MNPNMPRCPAILDRMTHIVRASEAGGKGSGDNGCVRVVTSGCYYYVVVTTHL